LTLGSAKGTFKTNSDKGRLDFSVKDLKPEKLEVIKEKILAWCVEEGASA
jgi:hypothetical protein